MNGQRIMKPSKSNGLKVVDGDNTDTIDIKIIRPEEATGKKL